MFARQPSVPRRSHHAARRLQALALPCLAALLAQPADASTTEPSSDAVVLPPLRVVAETQGDRVIQGPFLPEVVGTAIHAGKKTSVVDFDAMPQIQTDNYRQAFAKTPGLLTSELSNSSLLSLSYRGIGDPHESQNLMVLKDGIPFVLDPLGYPTVYFAPPFESLDRLEFIAGGAALLYGAQPSGALNYITHAPDRSQPWRITTQHILGSDSLYSSFSTLEGGTATVGYLVNFDHRSGDAFRTRNSDFELNGGDLALVFDIGANQRITVRGELYAADHGEPGGLTAAQYAANPAANLLDHDRVRLDRAFGSIGHELVGERFLWHTQVWASEVVRYSKRQTGQGFGTVTGTQLDINQHTYATLAVDSRLRLDHDVGGAGSTLTFGATVLDVDAPIFTERTAAGDLTSDRGVTTRFDAVRTSRTVAFFAENLFRAGPFTITPAVRVEFLEQSMDERVNVAKSPGTLIRDERSEVVPLGGLGVTYATTETTEFYGNVSTAYKPATYGDAFPTGGGDTVSTQLDAAQAVNVEFGYRGRPVAWASFDASVFLVDYDGRFGRVGSNIQNVGRSVNQGISLSGEVDLLQAFRGPSDVSLTAHVAYQYLDAEFTAGPLEGRTPQYAPEHMLRAGLVARNGQVWKVAALFTALSAHHADDANSANFGIPAYAVLDLTAECRLAAFGLSGRPVEIWALGGMNNALDEAYFSRVRANGIDPANGRNVYAGLRVGF